MHGEGFGAWCWYKTIALLEESGLLPIALDLAGSGINITDTKNVTTLAEYSKPLLDFLQNLPEDEKVSKCWILACSSFLQHSFSALGSFFFWNRVFLTGVSLQVILVGHSSGGACVSYALEHHPDEISKAVYLCATMISDGERPFDVFAAKVYF